MSRIVLFIGIYLYSLSLFAFVVIDDDGCQLHFSHPAQRIISLAPDITELLFAVGAKQQISGVIAGCDYPAAAKKLPIIGSLTGLDLEKMVRMQPDLIITWDTNFARPLMFFSQSPIPIYHNNPQHLTDVAKALQRFGQMTGHEKMAQQQTKIYREQLQKLQKKYVKPISVFYQLGDSLWTVNKETWINDAIELCGGKNLFADLWTKAAEVDLEAIIRGNPEVILSSNTNNEWQWRWQKWPQLTAIKRHHLYTIPPDFIDRASPRLIQGVRQICQIFNKIRA